MRRGKYYDQPDFPFVPGYDLVGIDESTGRRVAALTKTGGWADYVVLDREDLVPVPDGLSAEAVETVVVNGLTAWRMLHRAAKVRPGAHDRRARRGGRRRHRARPARALRGHPRDRDRRPSAAGPAARARRDRARLPRRGRAGARARARSGRRRRGLRSRRRPRHRRLLADARARRHARLLRDRGDQGRPGQPADPGAQAAGQAHRLEPAPERPQGHLLQPVGRQALPPGPLPRPAA